MLRIFVDKYNMGSAQKKEVVDAEAWFPPGDIFLDREFLSRPEV